MTEDFSSDWYKLAGLLPPDAETPPTQAAAAPPTLRDADYDAALATVRHAISQFSGCSEEERKALQRDLEQLHDMVEKLEAGRVEIVVFGEISTGKSALINALVGDAVAQVSVRGGWTKDVWHVPWSGAGYCVPGLANSEVVLIDTPGLNEVDGAQRGQMAREAAQRADLVLFVTDSDLNEVEFSALVELAASHKPILLVLNKADLYARAELAELLAVLRGPRSAGIVDSENVLTVKADPRVSVAAPATSPSTLTTTSVPLAALLTFSLIWPVAALCSSTDAATEEV